MSPVLGRRPRALRSDLVKPGAQAPGVGKGSTSLGKLTGAPRATGPDKGGAPCGATRHAREARRRPQPRHMDRCRKPGERAQQATNQGTSTGAKWHQPPSGRTCASPAANPAPASYGTAAIRMEECAPGGCPAPVGYEQPPSGWTSARPAANPAPAGYGTAAVRMDGCAPGGYPATAGYKQLPSGWTSGCPAATPRARNAQQNTPTEHTAEQKPRGPGHRTPNKTHRAGTPENKGEGTQDTEHAAQHTERAHR